MRARASSGGLPVPDAERRRMRCPSGPGGEAQGTDVLRFSSWATPLHPLRRVCSRIEQMARVTHFGPGRVPPFSRLSASALAREIA